MQLFTEAPQMFFSERDMEAHAHMLCMHLICARVNGYLCPSPAENWSLIVSFCVKVTSFTYQSPCARFLSLLLLLRFLCLSFPLHIIPHKVHNTDSHPSIFPPPSVTATLAAFHLINYFIIVLVMSLCSGVGEIMHISFPWLHYPTCWIITCGELQLPRAAANFQSSYTQIECDRRERHRGTVHRPPAVHQSSTATDTFPQCHGAPAVNI